MNPKILVVDDDVMTVTLISTYLQQEHFQVISADNGRTALDYARQLRPNLIILDLMLPQLEGLDVCRILRAETTVPIIMLTAKTTENDILLGIDLGADDYIKKPFSPKELVARVRMVLRRQYNLSPAFAKHNDILEICDLKIDFTCHTVHRESENINLTMSEFDLLGLMARHPQQVFTRGQLELLSSVDNNSMERTIDYHVMNLRRKLEPDVNNPRYITTVYGLGYKFESSPNFA